MILTPTKEKGPFRGPFLFHGLDGVSSSEYCCFFFLKRLLDDRVAVGLGVASPQCNGLVERLNEYLFRKIDLNGHMPLLLRFNAMQSNLRHQFSQVPEADI